MGIKASCGMVEHFLVPYGRLDLFPFADVSDLKAGFYADPYPAATRSGSAVGWAGRYDAIASIAQVAATT